MRVHQIASYPITCIRLQQQPAATATVTVSNKWSVRRPSPSTQHSCIHLHYPSNVNIMQHHASNAGQAVPPVGVNYYEYQRQVQQSQQPLPPPVTQFDPFVASMDAASQPTHSTPSPAPQPVGAWGQPMQWHRVHAPQQQAQPPAHATAPASAPASAQRPIQPHSNTSAHQQRQPDHGWQPLPVRGRGRGHGYGYGDRAASSTSSLQQRGQQYRQQQHSRGYANQASRQQQQQYQYLPAPSNLTPQQQHALNADAIHEFSLAILSHCPQSHTLNNVQETSSSDSSSPPESVLAAIKRNISSFSTLNPLLLVQSPPRIQHAFDMRGLVYRSVHTDGHGSIAVTEIAGRRLEKPLIIWGDMERRRPFRRFDSDEMIDFVDELNAKDATAATRRAAQPSHTDFASASSSSSNSHLSSIEYVLCRRVGGRRFTLFKYTFPSVDNDADDRIYLGIKPINHAPNWRIQFRSDPMQQHTSMRQQGNTCSSTSTTTQPDAEIMTDYCNRQLFDFLFQHHLIPHPYRPADATTAADAYLNSTRSSSVSHSDSTNGANTCRAAIARLISDPSLQSLTFEWSGSEVGDIDCMIAADQIPYQRRLEPVFFQRDDATVLLYVAPLTSLSATASVSSSSLSTSSASSSSLLLPSSSFIHHQFVPSAQHSFHSFLRDVMKADLEKNTKYRQQIQAKPRSQRRSPSLSPSPRSSHQYSQQLLDDPWREEMRHELEPGPFAEIGRTLYFVEQENEAHVQSNANNQPQLLRVRHRTCFTVEPTDVAASRDFILFTPALEAAVRSAVCTLSKRLGLGELIRLLRQSGATWSEMQDSSRYRMLYELENELKRRGVSKRLLTAVGASITSYATTIVEAAINRADKEKSLLQRPCEPNKLSVKSPQKVLILIAFPGAGKCWGAGTKLMMYDGTSKTVEDIVRDSKNGKTQILMGDDSTPRTVQAGSEIHGNTKVDADHQMDTGRIMFPIKGSHALSRGVGRMRRTDGKYECKYVDCDHLASSNSNRHTHESNVSLHSYPPPPTPAMYRITSTNAGRDSWTCNGDHVLVVKFNNRPSSVQHLHHHHHHHHHVKPYYFIMFEVQHGGAMDGLVVNKAHAYHTEAEACAAQDTENSRWQPLVWECTVNQFLRCSPEVQRKARMYQPDIVTFPPLSSPRTLRSILSRAMNGLASREQTLDTAWVIGMWLSHGVAGRSTVQQIKDDRNKPTNSHTAVVDRLVEWYASIMSVDRAAAEGIVKYHKTTTAGNAAYGVRLGRVFRRVLETYKIFYKKRFPHSLLTESKELRMALLAGIIDGDGYYDSHHLYEVSAKKRGFIDGLIHLCRGLGFSTGTVGTTRCTSKDADEVYTGFRIRIGGPHLYTIATTLRYKRAPCAVGQARGMDPQKDQRCDGFTVQKIAHADYFGFALNGNGRCLMDDFTVTHNSYFSKHLLQAAKEKQETFNKEQIAREKMLQSSSNTEMHDVGDTTVPEIQVDQISQPIPSSASHPSDSLSASSPPSSSAPLHFVRISQDELGSRRACEHHARIALDRGHSLLIDRTNIDINQRKVWIDMAKSRGARTEIIHLNVPVKVCKQRVLDRTNHETLPANESSLSVVDRFLMGFVPASMDEGVDHIHRLDYQPDGTQAAKRMAELIQHLIEA